MEEDLRDKSCYLQTHRHTLKFAAFFNDLNPLMRAKGKLMNK